MANWAINTAMIGAISTSVGSQSNSMPTGGLDDASGSRSDGVSSSIADSLAWRVLTSRNTADSLMRLQQAGSAAVEQYLATDQGVSLAAQAGSDK
ncbi:hypothetical protein M2390_001881 [Mycetocola sp. BIGb0189]|uniref:hypothetical protein n=1 Tax=Mycetocola sp. BIGb0189 TaxID=2940604 RepID=UPI002169D6E9|nr:hypothetical protein [Mycetocola sp. BIGb0189]MCS4276687.1 hypothetical protein [Mycetocola sp. BIGb0189]